MENLDNKKLATKLAKKCRQNVHCHLKDDDCVFSAYNVVWCTSIKTKDWLKVLNTVDEVRK